MKMLAHDINKGDRTSDVKITQNITFETMLLTPNTMKGLKESGFYKPSPIQLYGIPIGKCGFDLLLEAKSGTGKTAVFTIIALEKLDFCKGLQVVILTPTREIAAQICDVLRQIGSQYKALQVEVVMGGLPIQDDIEKFKKPVHIVVGSPGRLRHLIHNKYIDIKSVRLLVLDEADKLMESSFQPDIKYIHTSLPKEKQVIMSSATYPQSSRDVINSYVQNASHICPDSDCVLLGIDQKVSLVKYNSNIIRYTQDKFKELHKILGRLPFKQCLVFCNYQVRVAEVHNLLKKAEWPSEKLYGQQEQVDRLDALKTLQQYKCRILVSTDLAARGIDASNIDLVINFEPPYDWQTYLHRIGRAGRFGSYGLAITILSEGKEQQKFKEMFKSVKLSINMRHLWSDQEFNISNSGTNTPLDLCNLTLNDPKTLDLHEEVSCKNMWELLSTASNTIDFNKAFKSECKLTEDSDVLKIEPFSELMLSLEDKKCPDIDEDVLFKHIEMRKTSIKKSKVSQISVTENDTIIEDLTESKNEENSNDINKISEILRTSSLDSSKNIITVNTNSINTDNTDDRKNMLSLHLPIMFSSSKFNTHKTKKSENSIFETNTYSSNADKNKDLRVNFQQLRKNAEISSIISDTSDDPNFCIERHRTKINNHYERTSNYYKKENKCNYPKKNNLDSSNMRKFNLQRPIEEKQSAKSYSIWYKQLKMRMKYIEQAIYIDEMSKF